ncbi:hypothetical protein [Mangrovicoccus algicola]|uniref:Uncharacterized protein n=1 Tax=Mangrovicoccus algicola TaxID=2771008 RepID=A0A8J6YXU4_9RHOB|nr:hypothetical protein [Mangrovicoccus algicola]MBE3638494.1 hypothetical protein [Mangrovicoccus algicola]
MRNSAAPAALLGLALALGPGAAAAQRAPEPALPWLSDSLSAPGAGGAVETGTLGGLDRDATGLIPAAVAGLPADLWAGGSSDRVIALLERLPPSPYPGAQDLMQRLLLSEADPPARGDDALLTARVDALLRRGALDRAQALIERAGPGTPDLFRRWFDISLLSDSEDRACAALEANPALVPNPMTRVFCLAREGRWSTAALTLESGRALGDIAPEDYDLLARFLDPDLFEGEPRLPQPARVTPLSFRIYEAIGEPMATRDLPLAFAWSDLRFVAGWKAQLEAAERLARAGSMPGNRLLGLYTERKATVSGAIWDRVRAVQALDLALNSGDPAAVSAALIDARAAMSMAGLEPALAGMVAHRLTRLELKGPGAEAALRLRLLDGQLPGTIHEGAGDDLRLALAIATGGSPDPDTGDAEALRRAAAFAAPAAAASGAVGETILAALSQLVPGAEADAEDRAAALGALRAAGQEDAARRIAADMILAGGIGR